MKRKYLLAAEMFNYSYDNYADHIEVENPRFTTYMPKDATLVEKAEKEGWSDELLAEKLAVSVDDVVKMRNAYRSAVKIIDQETLDKIFREGVIASINHALENGLETKEQVEALAGQVCYRVADLSYLLTCEGTELRAYSEALRWEAGDEPEF